MKLLNSGAAPGCLLRGAKCLAMAARAQNFCASPEKVAQRGGGGGGTPTHSFFFDYKKTNNKKKTKKKIIMG